MADLLYWWLHKITDWLLLIGFIDHFFGGERTANDASWSIPRVIGQPQPESGLPAVNHMWPCIDENGRYLERMNSFSRSNFASLSA